ncbi:MAG: hypothetical protein IPK00_24095 [Deltaproteobacteria bacterium]|nr:hypothetical protein [Deltaproteobacteria bacterium]
MRSSILSRLAIPAFGLGLSVALAPTPAAAVTFEVSELGGCTLATGETDCIGELVTIGLRIGSEPDEQVYGIGASIYGYDESVADFESGEVVGSIFHGLALPAIGAFDGLRNLVLPELVESELGGAGRRVAFLDAFDLRPHTANANDPGLDGIVGGGDAQLRIRFRILGLGQTILSIGTRYAGDAVVYQTGTTGHAGTLQILLRSDGAPVVVPEPGEALLLALGLAGLACVRDQRASRSATASAIAR